VLRKYWGYDHFRPLQGRIVESLIGGNDTCVVMPTGGGKSLCYQLPAVVSGRTAVVVSPLIALMQDQAAQLEQMGIPAAALNSQISWPEQQDIMRRARNGEYRLLYVSPERLLKEEFIEYLSHVPLAFFAIDEAHCISEWGHEFRPEYRQLRRLRELFPEQPIAAFTASATQRVRHDILRQLSLRDPHKYIASFHRPNLSYLVRACDGKTQERLLLSAIEAYAGATMIWRCRNRSSSIIRRRDGPDAMASLPIACCCGRCATPGCWLISMARSRQEMNGSARGIRIMRFGSSRNRASAGIGRFVCISGKRRSGRSAMRAMCARPSRGGW
jgi:ATP-dependent DNA helicase RecQ